MKFRSQKFSPVADFSQSRCQTLLIFYNPVSTRARRRAKLAGPRRSRGGAAFGGAPGAEHCEIFTF
jgi:hypothetical protein